MFNIKVKSLFVMALLPFLTSATGVFAQDCPSCAKNANIRYAAPVSQYSQREIVRPVVENFDCANPQQNYAMVAPAPMPQPAMVRNMPQKVQVLPYVERNNEKVLRPLSDKEVAQRLGSPSGYMVSESRNKGPKYVMSSGTERQRATEPHYRDGSIFGGGPCKPSDKNGGIFGGGSCGHSNKTILASGPCKSCKGSTILPSGPCKTCAKPAPVALPAPVPAAAPAPVVSCPDYLATTVTYTKLPCVGSVRCMQPMPRPVCPCAVPMNFVPTAAAPCPCVTPRPQPVKPVRDCSMFAPISMEWVDFRLQRGVGSKSYSKSDEERRFKIFGCRSSNKSAILNEGRILEKDMNFNEIFADMVSDCYKVVPSQQCIDENTVLPEYVLTAEITDYFMNLCKDNAWRKTNKGPRGSSEMKVVWRLMDLSKTNVLWKGESVGHGELVDGDEDDEMLLIQRAFADATQKLRNLPGFEDRLLLRLTPEGMKKQRQYLLDVQKITGICEPLVIENCGLASSGCGVVENWVEVKEKPVETPAVEVAVETPEPEKKPVTSSAIFEADKICIVEREDDGTIGPDNLPMIKKSVVSVTNANGENGVGLLISEQFVMTSADLVVRDNNQYTVKTTDGKTLGAKAFRVNPRRNTALLVLNEQTEYTPLALNLELPAVDRDSFLSVGNLVFENNDKYLQNTSRISSYRYAEDGAAEIVVDSFDYGTTIGATLVDENGKVVALAHRKQPQSGDLFLPFETAMRSLGVEICGKEFPEVAPKPEPEKKVWRKPVAEFIDEPEAKAPEAMPVKNRK
ncbi:MAG: trypsin-like peptidase domain-containing protein [Alphaproteobacteria bacterium]|nr:trypsin-like peptidase domain-containing protein [Alphaproteobacteria bacterium]